MTSQSNRGTTAGENGPSHAELSLIAVSMPQSISAAARQKGIAGSIKMGAFGCA